jgi:hypothetical protein
VQFRGTKYRKLWERSVKTTESLTCPPDLEAEFSQTKETEEK